MAVLLKQHGLGQPARFAVSSGGQPMTQSPQKTQVAFPMATTHTLLTSMGLQVCDWLTNAILFQSFPRHEFISFRGIRTAVYNVLIYHHLTSNTLNCRFNNICRPKMDHCYTISPSVFHNI